MACILVYFQVDAMTRVKTPCIGVCSTGIGDDVCRGCKRFAHEIIHWNSYVEAERQLIVDRLDTFIEQVVRHKFVIVDAALLRRKLLCQKMHYQEIDCDQQLSAERCLYALLRRGANQIDSPEAYGFRCKPDWQHLSLKAMQQCVDQDLYTLSCAHYERYFKLVTSS
ncbi:MAG: DUF1289 domain-containing protein [Cellvibrionaceae bacterium]|nr:DUF1289 domain-containing protein [Cellvibrionaceae bacterium]